MSFKVIKNNLTHEERMMMRIRSLYRDLEIGDGDMRFVEDILLAIDSYLVQYDDPYIDQACWRIKEAIFYISDFNRS